MNCGKCGKKLNADEQDYFYIDGFFRKNKCKKCWEKK